jgi:putative colanic acid biosynthesis UDP-glucose lipid carrier transferase
MKTGKSADMSTEPVVRILARAVSDGTTSFPTKRRFDVSLALLLLCAAAPLMLFIAVAIVLESGWPAFFTQTRSGYRKRPFRIVKFRTMSHAYCNSLSVTQAGRNDARVTRVGRMLRALSLDELPQLFNVLSGDMSIVGPRPHACQHDDWFRSVCRDYDERFLMPPGITGLAQIRGFRGEILRRNDIVQRVQCDLAYVRNWSIWLDCKIIFATTFLVWLDKAAY